MSTNGTQSWYWKFPSYYFSDEAIYIFNYFSSCDSNWIVSRKSYIKKRVEKRMVVCSVAVFDVSLLCLCLFPLKGFLGPRLRPRYWLGSAKFQKKGQSPIESGHHFLFRAITKEAAFLHRTYLWRCRHFFGFAFPKGCIWCSAAADRCITLHI